MSNVYNLEMSHEFLKFIYGSLVFRLRLSARKQPTRMLVGNSYTIAKEVTVYDRVSCSLNQRHPAVIPHSVNHLWRYCLLHGGHLWCWSYIAFLFIYLVIYFNLFNIFISRQCIFGAIAINFSYFIQSVIITNSFIY